MNRFMSGPDEKPATAAPEPPSARERLFAYLESAEWLRKSITIPTKGLIVLVAIVIILNVAFLVAIKAQRMASRYGADTFATSSDIAALRQSVDALRTEVAALKVQPKPPVKK